MHGRAISMRRPDFLAGGGDMGARMRAHDWAATPLGPPDAWPQSLRSTLGICLHARVPTAIYWGPELRLFYNDAWAPIPAERHPWALGRPAREVWPDIWEVLEPQLMQVLETGEGFSTFDQMLPMERGGRARDVLELQPDARSRRGRLDRGRVQPGQRDDHARVGRAAARPPRCTGASRSCSSRLRARSPS